MRTVSDFIDFMLLNIQPTGDWSFRPGIRGLGYDVKQKASVLDPQLTALEPPEDMNHRLAKEAGRKAFAQAAGVEAVPKPVSEYAASASPDANAAADAGADANAASGANAGSGTTEQPAPLPSPAEAPKPPSPSPEEEAAERESRQRIRLAKEAGKRAFGEDESNRERAMKEAEKITPLKKIGAADLRLPKAPAAEEGVR